MNLTIPTLTVSQVEALWAGLASLAPAAVRQPVDDAAPTEALIEAIEAGDSLHEAARGLAWRGWGLEALRDLFNRSAARTTRPRDWQREFDDLERTVRTAGEKRAGEALRIFGDPAPLPAGARPPGEARPYEPPTPVETPEQRRVRQLAEAAKIGEGEADAVDLRPTIMTYDEMLRDLVYVESNGAVVHLPTRRARKADLARRAYAASKELWIDGNGQRKETEAFPLWMESAGRKSVDVITWSPQYGTFCEAPEREEGGSRGVNLWGGWNAPAVPADWQERLGPWREHIAYLIPDETERGEFEAWCAHIAQRPGELPHRFYLMIATQQGVGRNWIPCVLARVFRGYVAAGVTAAELFDSSYNGRLGRKVLVTVDEVKEGGSANRFAKAEKLKDMITKSVREINPKYGIQTVQYNCARWLMLSNHLDALPLERMDRRCVVIRNPDTPRSAGYYERIYDAIEDGKFIGAVWEYLRTLDISGFNAQSPAPLTASKRLVIEEGEGEVAKAIRLFFREWRGNIVDRDTLASFVEGETGGARLHARHFNISLSEVGGVVRTDRMKLNGRLVTIVAMGMTTAELDQMLPGEIRLAIEKAKAETTFSD